MAQEVIIDVKVNAGGASTQISKLKNQLDSVKVSAQQASSDGLERITKNGGAMAILNNLTGGLAMGFKDAYESIQLSNTGLKGMKAALLATGIGALVVAVGLIAANWESIEGFITGASQESKVQLTHATENLKITKEGLQIILDSENILKASGKTEREILEIKIAQTDEVVASAKLEIEAQQNVKQSQIEVAKRNKGILAGIIDFVMTPMKLWLDAVAWASDALGITEDLAGTVDKRLSDLKNDMANFIFDPEEVSTEADEALAAMEKGLLNLQNARAGYGLQINALDKTQASEQKAANEAALKAREKDHADSMDRITEKQKEALLKRQEDAAAARENELMAMVQTSGVTNEQLIADIKKREDLYAAGEEFKKKIATKSFGILAGLAELFSRGDSKRAKRAFHLSKALRIAEATASTYAGAALALADPLTPIVAKPYIIAAAITSGLGMVAQIASTKFEGGGGGSTGVGGFGSVGGGGQAPQAQSPQAALDFSFLNQQNAIQTYVIGEDVKTSNEANQKIKDISKL